MELFLLSLLSNVSKSEAKWSFLKTGLDMIQRNSGSMLLAELRDTIINIHTYCHTNCTPLIT